jgi:hypothetical protein
MRAQSVPPQDFAFRLEHNCPDEVFDTFAGTFTRQMRSGPRVIALAASPQVLKDAWSAINTASFFSYPSVFKPPHPDRMVAPMPVYRLDVRRDGQRHRVAWTDEDPVGGSLEVSRLRVLFVTLGALVAVIPEIKALPKSDQWCL